MNRKSKTAIILVATISILSSCASKEEEEEESKKVEEELAQIKQVLELLEEETANSSPWTNQKSQVFTTQSNYDPFTGFTQHALRSPVGETNREINGAKRYSRLAWVCSTDPDKEDFTVFYFDATISISEKNNENIPSSNDYATNYSWVGYQQIKVFEEVKPIKIIQQFSAMDHLFVVEGQDYIKQSAISLSNSEEPMLLKVELALDSALTYYSYVLNGFETHYTEFKKICP